MATFLQATYHKQLLIPETGTLLNSRPTDFSRGGSENAVVIHIINKVTPFIIFYTIKLTRLTKCHLCLLRFGHQYLCKPSEQGQTGNAYVTFDFIRKA